MNNTEKKLDALIDALGFDVECDLDNQAYVEANNFQQAMAGNCAHVNMSDYYTYKLTKRIKKETQSELILEMAQALLPTFIKTDIPVHAISCNGVVVSHNLETGIMEITTNEEI